MAVSMASTATTRRFTSLEPLYSLRRLLEIVLELSQFLAQSLVQISHEHERLVVLALCGDRLVVPTNVSQASCSGLGYGLQVGWWCEFDRIRCTVRIEGVPLTHGRVLAIVALRSYFRLGLG